MEWLRFPECLCKPIKWNCFMYSEQETTQQTQPYMQGHSNQLIDEQSLLTIQNIRPAEGTDTKVQSVAFAFLSCSTGWRNVTSQKLPCVSVHQILSQCVYPVLPTEMLRATCSTPCHSTHSFAFLHQNKKSHWFLLFMLLLPAPANNCHCCSLSIFDE